MINSLTRNSDRRVLLLTGGSGLLGGGLVRHLRRHDPHRMIAILTRHPETLVDVPGVVSVRADIGREDLGLNGDTSDALRNSVSEIIHCAADVRFNLTLDCSRRVNTGGTRRLLDFAEQCQNLEKFAHVSTLYIAGRRPGLVTEQELCHAHGYINVYEQSKHEAEQLVFERMHRLPLSVYRPSAIIGNAATGEISRRNFFHALIALAPRANALSDLPIDPAAPVDLIADDWCCRAIALLFDDYFCASATHHLCAGAEFALTARELTDMVFRVTEEQTGVRMMRPFIQEHGTSRSTGNDRALLELVSQFLPHLAIQQPFDRGVTGDILSGRGLTLPAPSTFVEQVIRQTIVGPPCRRLTDDARELLS